MALPIRLTRVPHAGLSFDVTDEGPLDGEVCVLLHGFPTDRTSWSRVAPLLHGAGLRTIAPDQRGYSPGARPSGRAAYRAEKLVGDVIAVANAAGAQRFHLVGHDWGGGVAWLVAGAHPDRVATVTVLSTPHPIAFGAVLARRDRDQLRRSWYMAAFQVPGLTEVTLRVVLRRNLIAWGLPEADTDRYLRRMAQPGALTAALNWYRAVPTTRLPARPCQVPATYVWGRRDPALGRAAAELTAQYCRAAYQLVELDAGHWLPELAAHSCAAAIVRRVTGG